MKLHKNIKKIGDDAYMVKALGVFGRSYIVNLCKAERYTRTVRMYKIASYASLFPLFYVLFKFKLLTNTLVLLIFATFYLLAAALCYHYVLTSKGE